MARRQPKRGTMHRIVKPAALTAAAVLALSALPVIAANAAPATAEECVQAGLVWVSVEYDQTVTGACAEKFSTASEALLSSGMSTQSGSWITEVDGRVADAVNAREWWSVYSKAPNADGTYPAGWEFAQVGVTELELEPSGVLAMVLQPDWNIEATPPATDPVEGVTLKPEATPTPTPEPTESATPSPSASATPTPEPSTTPEPTPTPSASETPKTPSRPGLPHSGA